VSVVKYRVSLQGLPPKILSVYKGREVLRLIIPCKQGRFEVAAFEGLIIKTSDPICQAVLDEYRPPKVPQVLKHQKDGTTVLKTWRHSDYKDVRPFTRIGANTAHHIEL